MDKFNDDDSGSELDESSFWYDEWHKNEGQIWLNRALTNQWSDNNENNMFEHLDELPYEAYESYEHKENSQRAFNREAHKEPYNKTLIRTAVCPQHMQDHDRSRCSEELLTESQYEPCNGKLQKAIYQDAHVS
ncbi:hypothetical protein J1N35_034763 [Gossypium stocksii]|uniref:Uncharacterized protein n=1 Tax=Gossypium stocksii TaxID=47602 RepID=A0A9D3USQ5_9ROSI|nr:hypothetical protein J1N35_034763 [Gossypium stocksii]